jgi:dihydropteroate synthase
MERKSTTSSNSTDREHRVRILRTGRENFLVREMEEIGVDPEGIALMSPKGIHRALRLEDLSPWQANLLKQEMLSLGGEAAVHRGALDCSASTTGALLMGTVKHFRRLLEKLSRQPPTMQRIGEELRAALDNFERRTFTLTFGGRVIELGEKTAVMGIVNVSPDSFYDGGKHVSVAGAVEHGLKLAGEGADLLDVGGESTRPGAEPLSADEEQRRVLPVIEALASRCDLPVSVDTYKAEVARRALEAGALMVNDISGLRFDPEMAGVVAAAGAGLVVMHMRGEPRTMQKDPSYDNLMAEIISQLHHSLRTAEEGGLSREQVIVDPGIGFGKTLDHNLHLVRHLSELRILGRPILVGPSRKSFLGAVGGLPPEERLEGTLAAVSLAVSMGAHVVRVHDVRSVKRAVQVADAVCRREP